MVFQNFLPISQHQAHPVHLHGHHFHVVHVGYGNCSNDVNSVCTNAEMECTNDLCDYDVKWTNGKRPFDTNNDFAPMKDTVIVPPGGYVVIRFRNDNPGSIAI